MKVVDWFAVSAELERRSNLLDAVVVCIQKHHINDRLIRDADGFADAMWELCYQDVLDSWGVPS